MHYSPKTYLLDSAQFVGFWEMNKQAMFEYYKEAYELDEVNDFYQTYIATIEDEARELLQSVSDYEIKWCSIYQPNFHNGDKDYYLVVDFGEYYDPTHEAIELLYNNHEILEYMNNGTMDDLLSATLEFLADKYINNFNERLYDEFQNI